MEVFPVVNILLVEDDEEICEILQFYLMEKEEYNVTITHSAEQARNLIRMRRFDIALLDIQLPGIDGIDFCAELRAVSNSPVIFISCINDDETIIRALNMGGDDYLVKPFRPAVLIAPPKLHHLHAIDVEIPRCPCAACVFPLNFGRQVEL